MCEHVSSTNIRMFVEHRKEGKNKEEKRSGEKKEEKGL
jgi:hypothetical protein